MQVPLPHCDSSCHPTGSQSWLSISITGDFSKALWGRGPDINIFKLRSWLLQCTAGVERRWLKRADCRGPRVCTPEVSTSMTGQAGRDLAHRKANPLPHSCPPSPHVLSPGRTGVSKAIPLDLGRDLLPCCIRGCP